jgi:DNA-binding NarL/FixJ family response regulator
VNSSFYLEPESKFKFLLQSLMTNMVSEPASKNVALIYEDHELFSSSFTYLLQKTGFFSSVYTFKTESELTQFVLRHSLHGPYLFCDYFVPGSNTIHLIFNIRKFCPSAKIIMLSSLMNAGTIRKLLSYKVDGFISKIDGAEQVTACLSEITSKHVFLSSSIQDILEKGPSEDSFTTFSPREIEVLMHSSWGKTIEQIAEILSLSKSTIITHRRNMLAKSGMHSFAQLVALGIRTGVVSESN